MKADSYTVWRLPNFPWVVSSNGHEWFEKPALEFIELDTPFGYDEWVRLYKRGGRRHRKARKP